MFTDLLVYVRLRHHYFEFGDFRLFYLRTYFVFPLFVFLAIFLFDSTYLLLNP